MLMRFAMTPAQIQLSYAVRRFVHEWAARFAKLSEKEIEEAIEHIDGVTEFFVTRHKRDDAA
jgi:hypothetical protein